MHPADTSYSKYWQLFTALHSAITQKIRIFAFHLSEFTDGKILKSMSRRKPPTNHTTITIRRWADKFCLHCNIFIYIRYIWIKPVPCSHMVSLFHHTSPSTHRCLQSSPSAHQNGRVFRPSVQTSSCY